MGDIQRRARVVPDIVKRQVLQGVECGEAGNDVLGQTACRPKGKRFHSGALPQEFADSIGVGAGEGYRKCVLIVDGGDVQRAYVLHVPGGNVEEELVEGELGIKFDDLLPASMIRPCDDQRLCTLKIEGIQRE